jgi:CRISPR-associated protein Cas2
MAADSKWYLVCYDIRNPKRLRKAAKHIEGYGTRMQYSVFRCWLSPPQMQRLKWELTEKIVKPEDDVMFIPLCSRCVEGFEVTHTLHKQPNWPDSPKSHTII